jgi:F-type H+-transporting ATPase subunit epsilon
MADKLKIVIVTPEKTTLDQEAEFVALPMIDGEAGILPGHAPMIGRLGPGELRIRNGNTTQRFFIDGGFAQVEGGVVSVLPGRSVSADKMIAADAKKALEDALALPADKPELNEIKQKAVAIARAEVRFTNH